MEISAPRKNLDDDLLKIYFRLEDIRSDIKTIYDLIQSGHVEPDDYQVGNLIGVAESLLGPICVIFQRKEIKQILEESRVTYDSQLMPMRIGLPLPPDED